MICRIARGDGAERVIAPRDFARTRWRLATLR
jgi:hypothetical protein